MVQSSVPESKVVIMLLILLPIVLYSSCASSQILYPPQYTNNRIVGGEEARYYTHFRSSICIFESIKKSNMCGRFWCISCFALYFSKKKWLQFIFHVS